MRQIHYISCSTVLGDGADLTGILEQSRHNNAIDGITGLLWSDGKHFMQVIEGPKASVALTFSRILSDDRHHHISILADQPVADRGFSDWTMAHRRAGEPIHAYDVKMTRLLGRTTDRVRVHFLDLMANRNLPPRSPALPTPGDTATGGATGGATAIGSIWK